MSYTTSVKIRFGDIDHAGIAYYPGLYHHLHVAFEEFFEDYIGTRYPDLLDIERVGFPTVKVSTEFNKPLRYGDTLDITISVSGMGRSSVELLFQAHRAGEAEPCFVSQQTVVAVDMRSFEAIAIPDKYRELFARCR